MSWSHRCRVVSHLCSLLLVAATACGSDDPVVPDEGGMGESSAGSTSAAAEGDSSGQASAGTTTTAGPSEPSDTEDEDPNASTTSGTPGPAETGFNTSPCTGGVSVRPETFPDGVVGEAYGASVTVGGADGWEVSFYEELPEGVELTLQSGSLVLTGTPSEDGMFYVELSQHSDDGGQCGQAVQVPWEVLPGRAESTG